jgi:ketosteroid isomerase-like protein
VTVAEQSNEDVVRRYWKAHGVHDYETLGSLRHRDWTVEWPQTGERIRGHANDRAAHEAYPGGLPGIALPRLVGSEDQWALTPSFTVQRIVGNGDFWWGDGPLTYPDGSTWFGAVLMELRDGKILRETEYFAPQSEAPAWRRPWVERIE